MPSQSNEADSHFCPLLKEELLKNQCNDIKIVRTGYFKVKSIVEVMIQTKKDIPDIAKACEVCKHGFIIHTVKG